MIYFLQDPRSLEIKIGYTAAADPEGRRRTLQTGNPAELVLLATMPGDSGVDAELKRRFAPHRVLGEWHRPVPELLEVILRARRREPDFVRFGRSDIRRTARLICFERSPLIHPQLCFLTSTAVGFAVSIYQISGVIHAGEDRYQVMPDDEGDESVAGFYEWYCATSEELWPTPEGAAAQFVDGWLAWHSRVVHVEEIGGD